MSNFYRPTPDVPKVYIPKWDRETLAEGFVPFPKKLMRCLREVFEGEDVLGQLQVVLTIADAKRVNGRPPTIDFLAYNAGMQLSDFTQQISNLLSQKLILVLDDNSKNFDVDLEPLLRKIKKLTSESDANEDESNERLEDFVSLEEFLGEGP